MCWPSDNAFKSYLAQDYITHCPITPHDVDQANNLYGAAPSLAQGKMIAPSQVANLASQILFNKLSFTGSTRVKLYVDIFYVNGLCFLHTKSKDINFITIHHLQNRQNSRLLKILKHIIPKYTTRGFTITDIFADNEFDHNDIHHLVLPANLHYRLTCTYALKMNMFQLLSIPSTQLRNNPIQYAKDYHIFIFPNL